MLKPVHPSEFSGSHHQRVYSYFSTRRQVNQKVDGSSTVYPITEAVAEEYQKENRGFRVTVGISGTGGGFKKFGRGETDISDASRPIKPTEVETVRQERHRIHRVACRLRWAGGHRTPAKRLGGLFHR